MVVGGTFLESGCPKEVVFIPRSKQSSAPRHRTLTLAVAGECGGVFSLTSHGVPCAFGLEKDMWGAEEGRALDGS